MKSNFDYEVGSVKESTEEVPISYKKDITALMESSSPCKVLEGHGDHVTCLAVVGNYLASGSADGTIRLWDSEKEAGTLDGHKDKVVCLEVIGNYLASGSNDKTVRLWNVQELRVEAVFRGHTDCVTCLVAMKDCLASGSEDGTVRLWSQSREEAVLEGHKSGVVCLAEEENCLASGSKEGTIIVWNTARKRRLGALEGHEGEIVCLAIFGNYLASGSKDCTVRLWNMKKLKQEAVLDAHAEYISCLAVAGNYLVSGSRDGTIRLWNPETRKEEGILEGHTGMVVCLKVTGGYLASGSVDGTIRVWNFQEQKEEALLESHTNWVTCLAVMDNYLASGSRDATVRLWSLEEKAEVHILEGDREYFNCLAVTENYLASGSSNHSIKLWDLEDRKQVGVLKGHQDEVMCLTVIKGHLASGSSDHTVRLWNLEELREEATLKGHTNYVTCLEVSNGYLVSGSVDSTIRLWDVEKKIEVGVLRGHMSWVTCLGKIGNYLASGSRDNTVRLWSVEELKEEAVIEIQKEYVSCLAEIENYLALGSREGMIRLWSVEEKKEVAVLKGHSGEVTWLTAVGKYLASGSSDCTVRLWNVQEQKEETTLEGHQDEVNCLVAVGNFLVSGSDDGTIRFTKLLYKYRFSPGEVHGIYLFKKLAESNLSQYNRNINHVAIMPERINLLHVLAYKGKDKLLRKALKEGCYFLESRVGKTPLTYSLENGNKRCTEVILKYIHKLKDVCKKRVIISKIGKDLSGIIKTNSAQVSSICTEITFSTIKSMKIRNLPYYAKSEVAPWNYSEPSSEFKDVKVGRSNFKFNFLEGSWDSLKLLKALKKTQRPECLRSDFVQALIGYKWEKFKWVLWTLGFLNLLNVLLIGTITFSSSTSTREALMGFFFLVNFLFTGFEVLQSFALKADYLKSSKNCLDVLRVFLGYVWGVISINSEFSNLNSSNVLTVLTSFLFWLEGVNAFKVFDSTRYYIWLIREVVKDTSAFLLILVYFVLAYCSLIGTTTSLGMWETFKSSYELLLGDFDSGDFDELQWFVFMLGASLNLIVVLNLLISIISESFDRITFESKESDTRMKLELILEIENCYFWNKGKKEFKYLYFVEEYKGEEEIEWESRIRKLYNDTRMLKKKIIENSEEIKTQVKEVKEGTEARISHMQQEMQENFQAILKLLNN